MKKIIYYILLCGIYANIITLSSCNGYLNEEPKGKKIPSTLVDYEAMLRYEYGGHRMNVMQALHLLNDRFVSTSSLGNYPLYKANYNWEEETDRTQWNNSDETTYYNGYEAIGLCNLVIDNALTAKEATDAERHLVYDYARVLRAMHYFQVVNYYADTYTSSTAESKLSVPLITSSDEGASYKQVSIQEIYDFMIKEVTESLSDLPDMGATILHPGKGAAYAFLARLYLQMQDYTNALSYAEKALTVNNQLYDWTVYYNENIGEIAKPDSYNATASPMGFTFIENYNYNHGATYYATRGESMPQHRGEEYETGDAFFLSNWKLRTASGDTYYYATTTGFFNYGGMRTVEMYFIKAECLARNNNIKGAMDILNEVRIKRILPAYYHPLTATTTAEAIGYIRQAKDNAMIMSIVPFGDARRYNAEGTYTKTLSKVVSGKTLTLSPTSHLWTMPFPLGAIENSGNGTITQNVSK
ncbi:MAG: RagB/SusD family nutrient uptake outer membrane protein [Bacteroides sp.]|jgi:tetratricopeptide (TPR) repeat protein|nr:RagB/SusD family nutrient uptake outer membrane protein [Bacteroides sp.]MCI1681150.1 RagB/SusD family nutrient uptake outer membrane protein [Bacteroides sp.]